MFYRVPLHLQANMYTQYCFSMILDYPDKLDNDIFGPKCDGVEVFFDRIQDYYLKQSGEEPS